MGTKASVANKHFSMLFVATAFIALLTGCGQSGVDRNAKVTGVVTINGELATSGSVSFHPIDGGPVIYGTIGSEGAYRLKTGKGNVADPSESAVPSGQYIAVVRVALPTKSDTIASDISGAPPKPGSLLVPAEYMDPETSPLDYSIKPGDNVINIDIEFEAEELEGEADQDVAEESVEDAEDESEESENDATTEPQLEGASS